MFGTNGITRIWVMACVLLLGTQGQAQRRSDRENPYEKVSDVYRDHWKKGDLAKALEGVDNAIRASADSVPVYWLTDRAELYFEIGDVAQAIDEIEWIQYRRPSPIYAWQLARYYRHSGRLVEFRELIEQAWQRASSYQRDDLETDEALALNAIAEVRGDNPRNIFQSILNGKMKTKEDRLLRYLAAGELAIRKFDYALAASYFEKALAEDATDLPALGGLATCYWHSYDSRLEGVLDRISAINPHYPAAQALRVERALDANELNEAHAIIEKQLARNPIDLQFRGLLLATFFLQDNLPGMTAIELEILNYNPHASQVFRIAGRIASRHYRFEEGAAFQKKALEADPNDTLAKAFYAQDLLRLGQDELGREMLNQAFAADRFNVQVFNLLELLDKVENFSVISRGPFKLRMPKREVAIWGNDVLELLETSFKRYSEKYKVKPKTPVSVQIFDNHDDFMVRSVGLPGNAGHLGICFGQLITMDSPSARSPGGMNWRSVMLHEFIHVITLQKTKNRMERWLSEGISVYEQQQFDAGWSNRLEMDYKWIVAADGIPAASELNNLFAKPRTTTHLMFGYFSAGEFVRFFVERFGFEKLNLAMDLIAEGQKTFEALLKASETTIETMDLEFKKFMEKRFEPFEALPEVDAAFLKAYTSADETFVGTPFKAKPGQFHQALQEAELAFEKQDWEVAESAFWKAYKLYPDYQGPDAPLQRLATLYAEQGRATDLEKALSEAAFGSETAYWACLALAELHSKNSQWEALAKVASRGLDIDPFDLAMNRMTLLALEKTKNTKAQLGMLQKLVLLDKDRSTAYRIQRIDLLITMGSTKTAKKETLELLEEMPSSWEGQQRLLRLAEAKSGGAP